MTAHTYAYKMVTWGHSQSVEFKLDFICDEYMSHIAESELLEADEWVSWRHDHQKADCSSGRRTNIMNYSPINVCFMCRAWWLALGGARVTASTSNGSAFAQGSLWCGRPSAQHLLSSDLMLGRKIKLYVSVMAAVGDRVWIQMGTLFAQNKCVTMPRVRMPCQKGLSTRGRFGHH